MSPESGSRQTTPILTAPLAEVDRELASQISKGHGYQALRAQSVDELVANFEKLRPWHEYNLKLLRSRFSGPEIADEYGRLCRGRR
jgi:hypothetical protein